MADDPKATDAPASRSETDDAQDQAIDKLNRKLEQIEDSLQDEGLFSDDAGGADTVIDGKRQNLGFKWALAEGWQKARLIWSFVLVGGLACIYLIITCFMLASDKAAENEYWNYYLHEEDPEMVAAVDQFSKDATVVTCAIYLDQITSVNIKNSQFSVSMQVGYRWTGDADFDFSDADTVHFYKGTINKVSLRESYDEGDTHYQRVAYDVTINKTFWTPRFPLDSHQMRVYLEPSVNVNRMVLVPDEQACGYNSSSSITGYDMTRFAVTQNIITYDQKLLNPVYDDYKNPIYKTEILTMFEINRAGFGLYIKCCVALYGTLAWILLCLYIATFRRVDALGMVGAAFFGAVSNVMVGSNLLPDALQLGLVEFINFFGVAIIVAGAAVVIAINTIRKERENDAFAQFYGRCMLWLFIGIVVIGNIVLPISAYL